MVGRSVFLVVTHGKSSLDLYSLRLARHLKVSTLHTDVYQRFSRLFNRKLFSASTVEGLLTLMRFAGKLSRITGIPHLPNQHLGRVGFLLKKPFIITVHDLIRYVDLKASKHFKPLIHKPNLQDYFWLGLDYRGVARAARIIVPSTYTKNDLVRRLGIPEEKIRVVYHGVDEAFKPTENGRPCPEPYILYVGSEHPRKNLKTLLEAFSRLKENASFRDLKLVKVGRTGGKEANFRGQTLRLVESLGLKRDVIFFDWLPVKTLASFYTQAELFAFPSLYEGFGWPPLEAMACGCPVVSSNASSMPEILGDAALYVNPLDVEGWAEALAEVLSSNRLRRKLSAKGIERAKRFTWRRTAEETLKVYLELEEEKLKQPLHA